MDANFVASTCWIQGVFVYKELSNNYDLVGYYGIPKDIDQDGYLKDDPTHLCARYPKAAVTRSGFQAPTVNPSCIPFEKTFYLQVS